MGEHLTALLPMKGHSERVPNKNLRDFNGKPLFYWMLHTLVDVPCIDEIIVDTDSEMIANAIREIVSDIKIVYRPKALQGDLVSMNKIIQNDLQYARNDHLIQTHCTNPLVKNNSLCSAIGTYFTSLSRHDSLFSVTRMQTRLYWEDGQPVNHDPEELIRTQDLPPLFEENSCFYLFSKKSFERTGRRIGVKPLMWTLDNAEAIDIDEPVDFELARLMHQMRLEGIL